MVSWLEGLPDELLEQILRYLPKHDLKSARLSSTQLSAIGASMLYDRVYFAPRKLEMEMFKKIAQNPVFSKNVKELVYDARLFREENREPEAYKKMISEQWRFKLEFAEQASIEAYLDPLNQERYSSCVDEQNCILDKKTDYHALLAGLGQMPIRRLVVQDDFGNIDPRFAMHNTKYPRYNEMSYLSSCASGFSPSRWNEVFNSRVSDFPNSRNPTWDCRGLAHLFLAVSECCYNIDELHIGNEGSVFPTILFHPSHGIINHIDRLSPRLTYLELASRQYYSQPREDIDVADLRLANLMQQAKQLRSLSLSAYPNKVQSHHVFDGWGDWFHLSLLDLGCLEISQDDLAAIIVSQKDSLTELAIRYIKIEEPGSWEGLGDEIGKYLRLHKVTIKDLIDDGITDLSPNPENWYLTMHGQRIVARHIMQWVSPELLELSNHGERSGGLLIASVKPEGKDVHEI